METGVELDDLAQPQPESQPHQEVDPVLRRLRRAGNLDRRRADRLPERAAAANAPAHVQSRCRMGQSQHQRWAPGSLPGRVATRQHGALPIQDTVAHKTWRFGPRRAWVGGSENPTPASRFSSRMCSTIAISSRAVTVINFWFGMAPAWTGSTASPFTTPWRPATSSSRFSSASKWKGVLSRLAHPACFLWSSSPSSSRCWPSS